MVTVTQEDEEREVARSCVRAQQPDLPIFNVDGQLGKNHRIWSSSVWLMIEW